MKELNEIQTNLVAPKGQTNSFGGYKYRNLEDILESAKPLLRSTGCTITFTDELVELANGTRIFCKSTATLTAPGGEQVSSTSFAELDAHKGMSKEQSSGSSSSYARKYALCSLLAIDDNRDPDNFDNRDKGTETGQIRASSRKPTTPPTFDSAPPQRPANGPKHRRVSMADFQNGKCVNLVESLMHYDPQDTAAWTAGLGSLAYRHGADGSEVILEFADGVLAAIESEARKQLGR